MENLRNILDFIPQFKHEISESSITKCVVRANLLLPQDAQEWIAAISKVTKSNWIVNKSRQSAPQRYVMHKSWVCHQNSRNKTADSCRKTDCCASVDILIKKCTRSTLRRDAFLKQTPPLCAVITLNLCHNHSTASIGSLKYLRVREDVRLKFEGYFSDGLAPAEAMRAHENVLMTLPGAVDALANGALNPIQRSVYHLHSKWKTANIGSFTAPLEKLKEKIPSYAKKGVSVFIGATSPYSVLVVTDVMKRAQLLPSSEKMIFIDSSAICDSTKATVTALLTVTKAGAIPIGVLIHEAQSTASYIGAFSMLAEHFPECFGGKKVPNIFMTDDSADQKSALKSVWPDVEQVLCHFHMARAEWRWLISSASRVPQGERKMLMQLFQKAMQADSEEILAKVVEEIKNLAGQEKFVERFHKNLARKEQWVRCFRKSLTTRENNTNNYAEATIRVLKDIVLQRTKAFNVVALVEFCGSIWNQYFVGNLLNFAHERRAAPLLGYEALCRRMKDADLTKIRQVSDATYAVPSGTQEGVEHYVDIDLGVCTCPLGCGGTLCKHQAVLYQQYGVMLPNLPPLAPIKATERFALAQLALGPKCPHPDFFEDLNESALVLATKPSTSAVTRSEDNESTCADMASVDEPMLLSDEDSEDPLTHLKSELRRIEKLMTSCSAAHIAQLASALAKITTESKLIAAIKKLSACASSSKRRGGKIGVQRTRVPRNCDVVTIDRDPLEIVPEQENFIQIAVFKEDQFDFGNY